MGAGEAAGREVDGVELRLPREPLVDGLVGRRVALDALGHEAGAEEVVVVEERELGQRRADSGEHGGRLAQPHLGRPRGDGGDEDEGLLGHQLRVGGVGEGREHSAHEVLRGRERGGARERRHAGRLRFRGRRHGQKRGGAQRAEERLAYSPLVGSSPPMVLRIFVSASTLRRL